MINKKFWDYQVTIEPLIKSLEFTLNKFDENPCFQASLVFPVFDFYPCEFKKDENPKHKTPHEYILERYNLNPEIPLGIIANGNTCLELTIEKGKINLIRNLNPLEFASEFIFDPNKYQNSSRYQILELGQINSSSETKLNEEEIISSAINFYNNYYPYLDQKYGLDKYYKGHKEIDAKKILLSTPDENISEKQLRIMRLFGL